MEDLLLTEEERRIKYEARKVVRDIPSELIRKMELGEVVFPREFIDFIARAGIVGLRFPKEYGGRGAS